MRLGNGQLATGRIGKIISEIGEAAGVKVWGKRGQVKYASAPDLRRSFGECWASRIMPQELMELMRHDSIETTVRYYVGRNAQKTAAALWAAHDKSAAELSDTSGGNLESRPNLDAHHTSHHPR